MLKYPTFVLGRAGPHAEASAQAQPEGLLSVPDRPDIPYGLRGPGWPVSPYSYKPLM